MQIKIGNLSFKNNVFLAPMAGITNLPFRVLVREFGCALAFTEMISANGLVRKTIKSFRYLDSSPKDKPLGVQIFGSDPTALSEAARIVTDYGADMLDINMGCPVRKVVKAGAGAALMKDPGMVRLIFQAIRRATLLPLTVKIRSGWRNRETNALDIACIAEDCGADAVILHPRSADQGFSGTADWSLIESLKKRLHIPVIGSGDIKSPQDALKMITQTGCDGIMVGRSALGNPWIFRDIISYLEGQKSSLPPLPGEREMVMANHMDMEIDYFGEMLGVRNFRKHLLWYTKGLRDGSSFRKTVGTMHDKAVMADAIRRFLHPVMEDTEIP
ncbi:MAG TPA: tRNA dihydrouridine synthase DusB [Syntrophales bacterium]|nr:tRNA dihydrouridine synthase DusB [Syntrophales bacterium]